MRARVLTTLAMLWLASSCRAGSRSDAQPEQHGVALEPASRPASLAEPEQPAEPELEPPEPAPAEPSLGVVDRGIFSDLDGAIQIRLPADLDPEGLRALIDPAHALLVLYADETPIKVYPLSTAADARVLHVGEHALGLRPGDHDELAPLLRAPERVHRLAADHSAPPGDRDADGIPDPLDLWIGIRKVELDAATYDDGYFTIDYPGGDVPRDRGACVDVIVRALRNVGVDLQVELHEDARAHPRRYPMIDEPNADIDHRRVRTVLPWFRAHWTTRPAEATNEAPFEVGEVVFMETMASRSGPDHIGWLFDPDPSVDSERPRVVNSWTEGYSTEAMDLLTFVPVTDRFGLPPSDEHLGPISAWTTQLVLVESEAWSSFRGRARRFVRSEVGGAWQPLGEVFPVVLGHGGMGWGRGRHGQGPPSGQRGPSKREGDGRTPAGAFELGLLYGRPAQPPAGVALEYHPLAGEFRCVDDPESSHYGDRLDADEVDADWRSAEDMPALYEYALVVEHNRERERGQGSCIFVHAWRDADSAVTGCTAMAEARLDELLGWLEPGAVLVALPEPVAASLAARWGLPSL